MTVLYGAQLFSNSMANTIDYCRDVLKYPEFEGSKATAEFFQNMNNIFNLHNGSNKRTWNGLQSCYLSQELPQDESAFRIIVLVNRQKQQTTYKRS